MPEAVSPSDEMRAATGVLSVDSPVHAPGTARILRNFDVDGYNLLIAICDQHDDPDNLPPGAEIHGQCGNCVFVKAYDIDLARQLVALINAREPLAGWLEQVADEADKHAEGLGNSIDEVATGWPLAVARSLNGAAS